MTPEQQEQLVKEVIQRGFPKVEAHLRQQIDAGLDTFTMRQVDAYPHLQGETGMEDRVLYTVHARMGKDRPFQNGFDAMIVKDIPMDAVYQGVSIRELEQRLQHRPDIHENAGTTRELFKEQLTGYYDKLLQDLITFFNADRRTFYKLAALYMPVMKPILEKDQLPVIEQTIKGGLDGDIRQQRFFAEQGVTAAEAYALMDSVYHPRAVYKVYHRTGDKDVPIFNEQVPANEVVGKWLTLDYSVAPNQYGNIRLSEVGAGFEVEKALSRFAFHFVSQEEYQQKIDDLRAGKIVSLTPANPVEHTAVYGFANPAYHSITLQSAQGHLLTHDPFLTPEARQQRAIRSSQQPPGQTPGATLPADTDGQKKNSDTRSRIIGNDDRSQQMRP